MGKPVKKESSNVQSAVTGKGRIFWTLFFTLLFLLTSWSYLWHSWNGYKNQTEHEAVQLAESLESLLHAEHIQTLTGTEVDLLNPDYLTVKENLNRLKNTANPIHFAYLIQEKNGQMIILLDSEEPGSLEYSPPGQVYEEADSAFYKVYQTGTTALTPPVEDRWGRWISVLVPVFDPQNGDVIALFGIDFDAREWTSGLLQQMIPDIIIVIGLLILMILFIRTWNQRLRLQELSKRLGYDEAIFRGIFDQAPIGIAIMRGTRFVSEKLLGQVTINPAYQKILGRTHGNLETLEWIDLTHPEDLPKDLMLYEKFQSGEIPGYTMEKRYIRSDGSAVWTNMIVSPLKDLPDSQAMHLCLVEDISERKEAEVRIAESERSKSVLLSNLPGMAYRCKYDRTWTMEFVSDGCYALTGYSADSLIQNKVLSYNDLIVPEYREPLWQEWIRILKNRESFRYEYAITTFNGQRKWVLELAEGIFDDVGNVIALEGIILDITDRKNMEEILRYQSEHDLWTGLYNRRYLEDLLEKDSWEAMEQKRAVISVNLSPLQMLSLIYGFHYYQNLLKQVATELLTLSEEDRRLFNTYENRFLFYVKGYQNRDALVEFCDVVALRLTEILAPERLSAGIGVLEIHNGNKDDVQTILKNLLIASEQAIREVGQGCAIVFFDETMAEKLLREENLHREMEEIATGLDHERLRLVYQPILDLSTNRIVAFEALARLDCKSYGLISPGEFIPIAEKTKLIIPLGRQVFHQALQFLKRIHQNGFEFVGISVNISIIQLIQEGFAEDLLTHIRESGVDFENVGIELTESVFATNLNEINRVLKEIRKQGIVVSIDDFGTGYSSLSRERELSVDVIKIDKSFIDKLLVLKDEETITSDIISMGHKLGHGVVAEGVEDERQLKYLKKFGCDKAQGYLIGKPMSEDAALEYLRQYDMN